MQRHGQLIAFYCLVFTSVAPAQPRIDPAGIDGAVLLTGSSEVAPATFEKFVELAGGAKAKIVILRSQTIQKQLSDGIGAAANKLGARDPRLEDYRNLKKAIQDATGVWFDVHSVDEWFDSVEELMKPKQVAQSCQELLKRGGVIGTSSMPLKILGSHQSPDDPSEPGLAIVPDSIFVQRTNKLLPLPRSLKSLKGIVGYEIDRDTTMIVKGRTISVLGDGALHVFVGTREILLKGKQQEDLTRLRRAARDSADGFPPKNPEPPFVEKGTLVIVGGGGSPDGLYKQFIEYAGGEGKACIAIFPTANPDPLPKREVVAAAFKKAGAKKATVLYGKTRSEVESKEFLDTLKEATGLWFDGGRQWRFVDCYENTKALPAMFDVLSRGGVIGGTSAGATIQGDYLCRGGVFNNFDIRYPGYERGLGFLKGVAIDQHFTQRKRQSEMTQLMKTYPQYLGIGLDEATAIVVKGQIADVIGRVHDIVCS